MNGIIIFALGVMTGWIILGISIYFYAKYFKSQVFKAFNKGGFDTSKLEIRMKEEPENPEKGYEINKVKTDYECPNCGRVFFTNGALQTHLRYERKRMELSK